MAGKALIYAAALACAFGATGEASAKHGVSVYGFKGGGDGANPYGGLVQDASGNFTGTTGVGGAHQACPGGCGTLFKVDKSGTHSVVYNFTGGADGYGPNTDLVLDADGNIYGATALSNSGHGALFELSSTGTFSVLHTFTGSEGSQPGRQLAVAANGDIYGTTLGGGAHNNGTIFKLSAGTLTTLYSFRGDEDGRTPYGGVVMDADGNLFGATQNGADAKCDCGAVYVFSHDGVFSVLHTFKGKSDGGQPLGPLTLTDQGLVGTTRYGGLKAGSGVIFRIGADLSFSVLHAFSGKKEGAHPAAALIEDGSGNLYGTAQEGGGCEFVDLGCGTAFRLAPDGTFTVLHKFQAGTDGFSPTAPLLFSGANLYGATAQGGTGCSFGCGMVFRLKNKD